MSKNATNAARGAVRRRRLHTLLCASLISPAILLAAAAGSANAGQLQATAFTPYNPANASSITPGPFALYTVNVDSLRPTQMNEGLTEVGKKAAGFDLDSPAQLPNDLITDIEPVVIGPGGQLYLTDGHHTFTALQDSIYGKSNPIVYVNVIANYSNLTMSQFIATMQSNNLLLPLNDGVPQTVNPNTGAPIPSTLTGLTSDPYRGLEYSILKNKSSKLFATTSNLTGMVGAATPGLDKMTGFYSDFLEADAYRGANGGLGLPYLSPGDIAYSTAWNLDLLPAAKETTSLPNVAGVITPIQLPGFILGKNIVNTGGISNATLATGAMDGAGGFTGVTLINAGTTSQPILVGTPNVGFVMQLGADNGDSVTLEGTNTYTGGTSILAGHLIVQSDASLGAATPAGATINPSAVLASVQAANGIVFNSLTEGAGTLTLGTTTGGTFATNRPIAVGGETATIDVNDNTVTLTGQLVSLGTNGVGLGNATGESDLTIDDLSAADAGKLILSTPSPLFYGNIIIGNTGVPTVEVMSDAALGNTTGPAVSIGQVELNGGTLQLGASFSAPERNLFLGGGSQIDVNGFTSTWGTVTDVQRTLEILNSSSTSAGAITFNALDISATATVQLAGGAKGETVTFTNGINRTGNDTLILDGSTATSLGTTEKVFSAGASATLVNGIAPAWIVTDNGTGGKGPYDFVAYTVANGYAATAYNANTTALNGTTGSEVIKLSKAVALTGASSVYALNTNGQAITEGGATLTVGDGSDPAGLILASKSAISGGNLAFGASEAVVWMSGSSTISSTISGSNGLTFAGSGAVSLSAPGSESVTGPLTIDSGTVNLTSANLFAGDSLLMDNVKKHPAPATLGVSANNELASLTAIGNNSTISLSNGASLTLGDTVNNLSSTIDAAITETGAATPGALTLDGSGLFDFSNGPSKAFSLVSGSSIVVNNSAQLRAAANEFVAGTTIVLNGTSQLQLAENGGQVLSNTVTGTGELHLIGGILQITSTNNSYTGGTVVETGSTLDITTNNLPTANPNITDAGGLIVFDQNFTGAYAGVISDGAEMGTGPVLSGSLDKDDSTGGNGGNLQIVKAQTYTGATTVEAGTLTLMSANDLATSSGVDLGRVGGGATATLAFGASQTLQGLNSEAANTTAVQTGGFNLTIDTVAGVATNFGGQLSGGGALTIGGAGLQGFSGQVNVPSVTVNSGELAVSAGTFTATSVAVNGGLFLVDGGDLEATTASITGGELALTSGTIDPLTVNVSSGELLVSGGALTAAGINLSGGLIEQTGGTVSGGVVTVSGGELVVAGGAFAATSTTITGGEVLVTAPHAFGSTTLTIGANGVFAVPGGSVVPEAATLTNSGVLDIRNGAADNLFTVGAYTGNPGSQLLVGFKPRTADRLAVSSATGSTAIVLTNAAPGTPLPFNPTGVPVVVSTTAMSPTTFTLANPAAGGLFQYDLAYNPAGNDFVLIGAPTAAPYQLATIPTAGQNIWYDTTGVWLDHQSDLRNANMTGGAGSDPGFWLRAFGDWSRRSQTSSYADLNRSYTFDSGYNLDVGGFVGGFDADRQDVFGKGDVLVLGFGGGYINSTQNFHVGGTQGDYEGGTIELTGSYLNQHFFVDGAVKADFLNLTLTIPGAAPFGMSRGSANLTNAGVIVDSGFRWGNGRAFLEPLASIAYVNTSVGGLALGGDTESFGSGDNARVRVGLSGGVTLSQSASYVVQAAVTGSYWARIAGDSSATVNSGVGAPLFTAVDQQVRNFGEIGASLDATPLKNGLAGFVQFDYQFGTHYDATQVKAGARIAF